MSGLIGISRLEERKFEIDAAFAAIVEFRAGALVVSADPFFSNQRAQIVALAARHAVPAIYIWREYVAAGGLMSYGTDLADSYRQVGIYTGKIQQGAPSLRICRSSKW